MAGKDSLRPCRSDIPKWPPNGRQNPTTFLASGGNRRKCSVPAFTLAFLRTISRHRPCRVAPCESMLPGGAEATCRAAQVISPLRKGETVEVVGMAPDEACEH